MSLSFSETENPFVVQTPEDISATDATSLFVDVFTDFYNIPNPGHAFLHGPRGSGKSMMFRFLEPDCQMLALGKGLSELPFYGVYVPVKNTDLKLTEFKRLEERHANVVLNEHFLVAYVAVKVFGSLQQRAPASAIPVEEIRDLYEGAFKELLGAAGWTGTLPQPDEGTSVAYLSSFVRVCNGLYTSVVSYLKQLSFRQKPLAYSGPLCGFLDFLLPLLKELSSCSFMPKGPIYVMIDDADNLNYDQTTILNSWVFSRTSAFVSLKISTQLGYKTYRTVTGPTIDAPHDYSEVNISSLYTSARLAHYRDRVKAIISKRLAMKKISIPPEQFFPGDSDQEAEIAVIKEEILRDWAEQGHGFKARDDAYRYAIPIYMTRLTGARKSASKYRYAGFPQLVNLSSGIVRYFLDGASKMYAAMQAYYPERLAESITPEIQDKIARDEAEAFLTREFDRLIEDESGAAAEIERAARLRDLIHALGGMFREILLSDAAERRVFSVALADVPDDEVKAVLRLGVQHGYFHESTIGNKEGNGRTSLFVLSRRVAPFFNLDPNGFSAYRSITSDALRQAMFRPKTFLGRIRAGGLDDVLGDGQLNLFQGDEVGPS